MKTKLQFLGISILFGCFSLSAQTTHNIDWTSGVGAAATLTIQVGDEIVWTNVSTASHSVVSSDPNAPAGFGSGTMGVGDTYSFTFNDPLEFGYVCGFHSAMTGTITVLENVNCAPPLDIGVTNITSGTADFFWTGSADETNGYTWVVMNQGDDPLVDTPVDNGSEVTGSTTASTTALVPETDYDFYIATECGQNGDSGFSGPTSFTTETAGLNTNELEGFKFYPNPASETVNLEAQENIESVTVYNMMSQKVLSHIPSDNMNSIEMNVSNLETGSYFIEVKSGNKVGVYKLIKR